MHRPRIGGSRGSVDRAHSKLDQHLLYTRTNNVAFAVVLVFPRRTWHQNHSVRQVRHVLGQLPRPLINGDVLSFKRIERAISGYDKVFRWYWNIATSDSGNKRR